MAAPSLKEHVARRIEQALDAYCRDLEALDEPELARSAGGNCRSPFDFTYEVVFVNRRIAKRLRGEEPEPYTSEGWITAPDEFQDKQAAIEALRSSSKEVLDAWNALPEAELDKTYEAAGNKSTMLDIASLCATHLVYHDAQLNLIQCLQGDDEVHWA